jgi:hypothetical protein
MRNFSHNSGVTIMINTRYPQIKAMSPESICLVTPLKNYSFSDDQEIPHFCRTQRVSIMFTRIIMLIAESVHALTLYLCTIKLITILPSAPIFPTQTPFLRFISYNFAHIYHLPHACYMSYKSPLPSFVAKGSRYKLTSLNGLILLCMMN